MLDVAVHAEPDWGSDTDWQALAERAVAAALERTPQAEWATASVVIEVAIRLTSDDEVHTLNRQYRQKDKSTNVLSFPMIQPDLLDTVTQNSDDGEVLLGDIVLAHGVCAAEAQERNISVADHATHLIVHGCLHLLGYDHQGDAEADGMEAIERLALDQLGLHDPYPVTED
ncbi:rRNA maturation RNase YbeY [Sphingomonas sp. S1-29]|uniref:rRNA maturation RNase YbeY n=1 Tax=Sphingomonas sp. S1-29 TaxID=2991074 RepID=UPI00223F3529|nr:rRNA maturation RNase YbeY [Sphingomonas sp. S1-29]UZK68240.1 rRNA maturation RNase YbeY [Sphingomonas sp. S1-29]